MGMYDNYDKDQAFKMGMSVFIFLLALCLIMVCANCFAGAAIAWYWVCSPIWGIFAFSIVMRIIMAIFGIKPPQ